MVDQSSSINNAYNNANNVDKTMTTMMSNINMQNFIEPLPVNISGQNNLQNSQYLFEESKFNQGHKGQSSMSNSQSELDNNNFTKRKKAQEKYECKEENCGKVFYDKGAFRKHQLTHGEKLFICKVCNKKFLDNSKLRRHSLVHSGEKNYKCEICGKKFSLDFNLRTHMRIHSGEKPYACVFPGCFKRFSQSSNLSAHEKTHEMMKGNGLFDESLGKPIFLENPLKYLIDNPYSGTETIENIKNINKLYDLMKIGLNFQPGCSNGYGEYANQIGNYGYNNNAQGDIYNNYQNNQHYYNNDSNAYNNQYNQYNYNNQYNQNNYNNQYNQYNYNNQYSQNSNTNFNNYNNNSNYNVNYGQNLENINNNIIPNKLNQVNFCNGTYGYDMNLKCALSKNELDISLKNNNITEFGYIELKNGEKRVTSFSPDDNQNGQIDDIDKNEYQNYPENDDLLNESQKKKPIFYTFKDQPTELLQECIDNFVKSNNLDLKRLHYLDSTFPLPPDEKENSTKEENKEKLIFNNLNNNNKYLHVQNNNINTAQKDQIAEELLEENDEDKMLEAFSKFI